MNVSDLDPALIEDLVARARGVEPDVVGVFAFGSYARDEATPTSDLDLQAVTHSAPSLRYRTWFAGDLHVSVGIRSTDEILERCRVPANWSLGFATSSGGVWLWAEREAMIALGDPPGFSHPADPPELEDFVESCAKTLRASNSVSLRVGAQLVGETAPPLLRDLNEAIVVNTRAAAVRAAAAFAIAPDHWAEDLLAVLGLAPVGDEEVRAAVVRIAAGVLRILRERKATVGDRQPDLTRLLLDGTLERHLGV